MLLFFQNSQICPKWLPHPYSNLYLHSYCNTFSHLLLLTTVVIKNGSISRTLYSTCCLRFVWLLEGAAAYAWTKVICIWFSPAGTNILIGGLQHAWSQAREWLEARAIWKSREDLPQGHANHAGIGCCRAEVYLHSHANFGSYSAIRSSYSRHNQTSCGWMSNKGVYILYLSSTFP